MDVVLLKDFEAWQWLAEAGNFTGEVRKQMVAWWDGKSVDIAVGAVASDAVCGGAHACFVEHIGREESWWVKQSASGQLFDE